MKTAILRRGFSAVCAVSLALLSACGVGDLVAPTKGRMAITVKWPAKKAAFTIQAIPEATVRIEVSIRGEGIPDAAPLKAVVTPSGTENASTFVDVPIGPKFVEGVGYDAEGRPTALGGVAIAVQPNALVEAHLVLQAVDPKDIQPLPTPTPTPVPTPTGSVDPTQPTPTPVPSPSIDPIRVIETLAGDGVAGALDAQDALAARFYYPRSLVYDQARQVLFVADSGHRLIRRIELATGAVTTVAGRPSLAGTPPIGVPPALASAASGVPSGLAIGPEGDLYFCDRDNHMIRKITAAGRVEDVAGTGRQGYLDGAAGQALFSYPSDLSFDNFGNLYVADTYNNRVRRITGGQVTTVIGSGATLGTEATGLRLPAPSLDLPTALVAEPSGKGVYVAEGRAHRVLRYELKTGALITVAGSGNAALAGEGGPALQADIALPTALALDVNGELLITDSWALKTGIVTANGPDSLLGSSSRVLRLTSDGKLVRVAGSTTKSAYGFSGDGGDARKAELNNPSGIAVDAGGRIFVADTYNNRIRVIQPPVVAAPVPVATPTPEISPSPAPAPSTAPTASPTATPVL